MAGEGADRRRCPKARVKRSLVSDRERAFTDTLMKAFTLRVSVLVKVRVLDVIEFDDEPDERKLVFWRDALGDKRFDYVVCRRKTLEPLLAVDLADPDDESAPGPSAAADSFKARIAREAKFPFVHFSAEAKLTPELVRQKLMAEYAQTRPDQLPEELG